MENLVWNFKKEFSTHLVNGTQVVKSKLSIENAILSVSGSSLNEFTVDDENSEVKTLLHIINDIVPSLPNNNGSKYFGFVTGGSTPIAEAADNLVSFLDQNAAYTSVLLRQNVIGEVENQSLVMLCEMLGLNEEDWRGRTVTTGATSSNVLGLACGRDYVLGNGGAAQNGVSSDSTIKIISCGSHSSIQKAAGITGIGRNNIIEKGLFRKNDDLGVNLDLEELNSWTNTKDNNVKAIVVVSFGEVNTGAFTKDVPKIRKWCDDNNAWLHIDGAFGIFASLHPSLKNIVRDLHLADSITGDCHKWLNVPYDCGFFLTKTKHLPILLNVCSSGSAPYLGTTDNQSIFEPYQISIENSQRFRSLPLYASLKAYGIEGYRKLVTRNIEFARKLENWLRSSHYYRVLTPLYNTESEFQLINIVLFTIDNAAPIMTESGSLKDAVALIHKKILDTGLMQLTTTVFNSIPGFRIAVSNWMTGLSSNDLKNKKNMNCCEESDEDFTTVISVLTKVME
ncbi:hypothetical protein HDU92_005921 [Lobulomyces angularis]|nr:hypothetical protein HDU92_005921 [Lobulomyces angularis]